MYSPAARRRFLYNQPHIFHALTMLGAGADDINPRCVNAAVTENIGELGDVLLDSVENAGKQVAQIVREYLIWVYIRLNA